MPRPYFLNLFSRSLRATGWLIKCLSRAPCPTYFLPEQMFESGIVPDLLPEQMVESGTVPDLPATCYLLHATRYLSTRS